MTLPLFHDFCAQTPHAPACGLNHVTPGCVIVCTCERVARAQRLYNEMRAARRSEAHAAAHAPDCALLDGADCNCTPAQRELARIERRLRAARDERQSLTYDLLSLRSLNASVLKPASL